MTGYRVKFAIVAVSATTKQLLTTLHRGKSSAQIVEPKWIRRTSNMFMNQNQEAWVLATVEQKLVLYDPTAAITGGRVKKYVKERVY